MMLLNYLVRSGVARAGYAFWKTYHQLEVLGAENIPPPEAGPCVYIMNHSAVVGLDVAMILGHLLAKDPQFPVTILAWRGFTNGLGGSLYRGLGCKEASIERGVLELRAGVNIFILPEGVDATDVRSAFGPFHTGYLRIVKEQSVPIVPIGFFGIDQVNPWFFTEEKHCVQVFKNSLGDEFDVAIAPKFPFFRPVKVVYRIGRPIQVPKEDLATEEQLSVINQRIRDEVVRLAGEAETYRHQRVGTSKLNSWWHDRVDGATSRFPYGIKKH